MSNRSIHPSHTDPDDSGMPVESSDVSRPVVGGTIVSDATSIEEPVVFLDVSEIREVIFQYAGAEAALGELCRHGVDADGFLRLLAFTVEWSRPTDSKRQPDWQIPGMPPRRLLKLAERIEGIAGELEKIQSHPFIKESLAVVSEENKEEFRRLPDLLRKRAYFLSVQVKVKTRVHPRIERALGRQARLNLVDFVRKSTNNGHPMYSEVALLLTAGLCAMGLDEAVTPESLRTLWHDDQTRQKTLENPT